MESRVLNFTHDMPTRCSLEPPLRMILWAGDGMHNGVTDIERLPNFDIYVCMGYPSTLQPNIDYLYNRIEPGVICIIDVSSHDQMQRFIKEFAGRITTIDADYHGNTPRMLPEYYYTLLANGGTAYNVEGINSMMVYMADYKNALEVFGPILPDTLKAERRYTPQMIQLAKDNDLSVDFAWTSPDLKDPYYDDIRKGQANYAAFRESLNPNHHDAYKFNEKNLEEYWSSLAPELLTFNYNRAILQNPALKNILEPYFDRFNIYLTSKLIREVDDVDEFRQQILTLEQIQKLYKISSYARKFTGFSKHISTYHDLRYNGGPVKYGVWLRKVELQPENTQPY
jgi:hypothetical protein